MEVFADWNLGVLVADLVALFTRIAWAIFGIAVVIKVTYEIARGLLLDNFRLGVGNFIGIVVVAIVIGGYAELWGKIGDAFYALSIEIRGEAETAFRNTAAWEAIDNKVGIPENENVSTLDLIKDWAGTLWGTATGWLQNLWSLAFSLSMQPLAWIFRAIIVAIKNIVYAFMLIGGPIPLALSLIPGLGGLAAHWIKNFIVVSFWNVTIAIVDVILEGLDVALMADMFNGDEELSIAMLTMLTVVMYLMVPFLTSMLIGQTVVAMAGQKMFVQPLTTAAILGRLAAGIPAIGGGGGATKSFTTAAASSAPSNGASQKAGLITMGSSSNQPVRTGYTSAPSRSQQSSTPEPETYVEATPVSRSNGNIASGGGVTSSQRRYRRPPRYIDASYELPSAGQSESLNSARKAKYLPPKSNK